MFKTGLLLAAITAIFLTVGFVFGGTGGMMIALVFALVTNVLSWWFSDTVVLKMYRAQPLSPATHGSVIQMVERLSRNAGIPTPKAYLIDTHQPNAFATGRSPSHSAVAVTRGLIEMLDQRELAGVIAHELGHIRNRDTLTMTMTAVIAGAIGMLTRFAFFSGGRNGNRQSTIMLMAMVVLAPLAAMLVQMAISRTREYKADRAGAEISRDPLALASALAKISQMAGRVENYQAEQNPATAHLFIVNPLSGQRLDNLFATHPSTENRIYALKEMAGTHPASVEQAREEEPTRAITRRGTFEFTE